MSAFEFLLRSAAVLQIVLAVVNFGLIRLLGWKKDIEKLPLLAREVFQVHLWFIGITCGIFGVLTWRFAPELAEGSSELGRWLADAIAIFWGVRAILQLTYYSSSHWRGHTLKTLAHVGFFIQYGGLALLYAQAGWRLLE